MRLVEPAARAWRALTDAALAAGHTLKATSLFDSYRPFDVQEHIFRQRYTRNLLRGRPSRVWQGKRWFQRPGTAVAAAPGTSNHGFGLAVDTGEEIDGDAGTESIDRATLEWLIANEFQFGFSHELQSEAWHIRYCSGDQIPAAVLAYEGGVDMTPEELLRFRMGSPGMGVEPRPIGDWFKDAYATGRKVDQLVASAAAEATRDAAMLAAIQALAVGGGVDAAPIVAAVREEAARTRQLVTELQARVAELEEQLELLRPAQPVPAELSAVQPEPDGLVPA